MKLRASCGPVVFALALAGPVWAQAPSPMAAPRDEFFWLSAMNKASLIINSQQGLLDPALAPGLAAGLKQVIAAGNAPGARRPSTVITFEPLLIKAAGEEVTLLHAGRSSQDMHATYRAAILRDDMLALAEQLNKTSATMLALARKYSDTPVPNYTNGVAAQPNAYGHYLLGHLAGFNRDAQRLREAYARLDRSAMGTTVLNGTSWPLDRKRMSDYLGFDSVVDNAYDAAQIASVDAPVEAGAIVTSIALHTGSFVQDVMTQYAQARPWILLQEGGANTYVSSAMPQKRNPGLLIRTRSDASAAIARSAGVVMQAHNITPGMSDPKDVKDNKAVVQSGVQTLAGLDNVLKALVLNPERALEELNSDWTASQELADVLMREHKLPFRVGHHFASNVVDYARQNNIKPLDFPYEQARAIYAEAVKGSAHAGELPMSEAAFRAALDPARIIASRASSGGPQAQEMTRMLEAADQALKAQGEWIVARRDHVDAALRRLDEDFERVAAQTQPGSAR